MLRPPRPKIAASCLLLRSGALALAALLSVPAYAQFNPGGGGPGTGGTVTSISSGCGSSTGGGAITTSGTISSVEVVNLQTGANYTVVNGDCGKLVDLSNGSAQTP